MIPIIHLRVRDLERWGSLKFMKIIVYSLIFFDFVIVFITWNIQLEASDVQAISREDELWESLHLFFHVTALTQTL